MSAKSHRKAAGRTARGRRGSARCCRPASTAPNLLCTALGAAPELGGSEEARGAPLRHRLRARGWRGLGGGGGGRGGTRRAEPPSDRREAETFDRTSGMSWKSALESSVPMDSAMKNVRTRLKKAFWVQGTMRRPSSEATFIMDTLRKPKPHAAEREETRGGHYQGWGGEGRGSGASLPASERHSSAVLGTDPPSPAPGCRGTSGNNQQRPAGASGTSGTRELRSRTGQPGMGADPSSAAVRPETPVRPRASRQLHPSAAPRLQRAPKAERGAGGRVPGRDPRAPPSAELGLLSSVCSFSSFSRFSAAHAADSSCCRTAGQKARSSAAPSTEPSLRLCAANSSAELKHCGGRRRTRREGEAAGRRPARGELGLPGTRWRGAASRCRAPLPRPGG